MVLMEYYWHMMEPAKPSLCISVIGGAKNFVLEGRRKDVFNTGLIQAAQTTNAWIVTSGLNLGIVRVVGDALQEGQTWHFDRRRLSNKLRCLGISPWGYVLNRNELKCDNYDKPVLYRVSNVIETGRPVSLNENHTHYIFVDEGRRLRYGGSASATFRARLGKQMALPEQAGGWGIPVVLVVVEGGHDVFIDARDCIRERIPVVICCGTGRASDLMNLAFTYRMKQPKNDFKDFRPEERNVLLQALTPISRDEKEIALEMIIEIIQDPKLITIFNMNQSDDLDLAILFALIKTNSQITTQLELAFTWDRSDIAEEKVFRQGVRVGPESLEPIMMKALLRDKPEFVRILLQNGIVMRQFLTVERLSLLYNKSIHRNAFERCLSQKGLRKSIKQKTSARKVAPQQQMDVQLGTCLTRVTTTPGDTLEVAPVYLSTVSRLVRKMIGRFLHKTYEQDTQELRRYKNNWNRFRNYTFDSPFHELFLWAVLHHRQRMAMFFWERADDSIALAMIACALYADMIKSLPNYDTETQVEYVTHMDEFERLAVQLLEECYTMDPEITLYLVEHEAPLWGGYNCLNLADKATRRKFISSVACQNSLFYAWSHGTQASPLSFTLTLFCPLLLLSDRFVEFNDDRGTEMSLDQVNDKDSSESWHHDSSPSNPKYTERNNEIDFVPRRINPTEGSKPPSLPLRRKLLVLYTAPRTKFFLNTIAYIAFLLFFSYTLLFKISSNEITVEEALTMTYFVSLLVDIIRQICVTPGAGSYKLRLWVKINSLVYLDIIGILLAMVSIFLRIGLSGTFTAAKTLYSLTLIICYMRIFRLYGFHPALGPKLVMIQRMIAELFLFLLILAVILISYGVSMQALLFPNRTIFDWNTIRNVLYYPYFNLYGELNLDYSLAIKDNCTSDADGVTCPQYNFMVPLLLAIYLMLAGILLINLLIAIFSNVFQQVEDNSIELWKFNMYGLVVEYNKKPVIPVPFSIIQAVVEVFQFLVKKCNRSPGVKQGVKVISAKASDIQNTITIADGAPIGDDLFTEAENAAQENQNDEGAQLFQFVTKRGSRRFSFEPDSFRKTDNASGRSYSIHKDGTVIDEEETNLR
ncbi:putative transient receptor potential cation channel subfamily m member [Fasciola gigantica]|uniref:Putative transient receptor potential cation channel subfamily m member n=1 Tax=Fasciola gigantica TaxID=46835 RepID=A0A504YAA7_FASGI|nr:putative transient receptor potential cation channel subfamily m member [Fasciola gigantica]